MPKLPKGMPKPNKKVQLVMPQNIVQTPKEKAAVMPKFKPTKEVDPFVKPKKTK